MINLNLDSVEEKNTNEFERPGAGGYVLKVISAKDVPDKNYVMLLMDISEGKFKNYGENTEARTGQDWAYIKAYLSYKESALGFLKHNVKLMDADNPNKNIYERFNKGDITCLNGAYVCAVIGEQEYKKNDGSVGVRLALPNFIPAKDFRANNYTVPALKKLPKEEAPTSAPMPSSSFEGAPF